jgi:iron complex transport system substrate-binding protein/vitamin B12 transport system substrate-binding protein
MRSRRDHRALAGAARAAAGVVTLLGALAVTITTAAAGAPPAMRAITLAPHITELVFAAGAGDKIVATVSSSDYPEAARSIPRIGDGLNISVERVLALHPDVVVAWLPSAAAHTLAPTLTALSIPIIYSEPRTLADIPRQIARFGKLFGTSQTAEPTAQALNERIQTLRERYSNLPPVSVFIEIGTAPLYTIGADPLLNDALHICGGINVYAESPIIAPQVSTESVLVHSPNVVIAPEGDNTRLDDTRSRWLQLHLAAAQNGHIYGIDPDALFRPGPRLIDATEALCRYLDMAR